MPETREQDGQEVLTLQEAASFLRVSEEALAELADHHAIPAQRIAGEWRFLRRALANWLAYGPDFYHELRRFPPWAFEYPPLDELIPFVAKLVLSKLTSGEQPAKRGTKQAVLKHFGVFRDDQDLEERLKDARVRREAGG
jgi:excisionase family DNA binding protein